MRVISTIFFILLATIAKSDIVLQNGDFNNPNMEVDFNYKSTHGRLKLSLFTEDRTWNKCLKVEIASFRNRSTGTKLLASELIFGKKGFGVKANETYKFSFNFKGNIPVSLFVYCYNGLLGTPNVKLLKTVRPNPKAATPESNNWTKVEGSFKIPENTKCITFSLRFWADSAIQRNFSSKIGDFLLLDNIKLAKKATLENLTLNRSQDIISKKHVYKDTDKVEKVLDFIYLPWQKNVKNLPVFLQWKLKDNKFFMNFTLEDNSKGIVKGIKSNSKKIYLEDVAEVFFADSQGSYSQFACSISGGRYQSVGGIERNAYQKWKATSKRIDGKIVYHFEIPITLLSSKDVFSLGNIIKFNIGIKHNNIFYTLSPVKSKFNEIENFSLMAIGSIKDYQKKAVNNLKENAPKKILPKINKFAQHKYLTISDAFYNFEKLRAEINALKMGTDSFVLATLPLSGNFSYPLEISPENLITKPIKLQAAINEIAMFPLVICNRTNKAAAYRVIIHDDAKNFSKFENPTLSNNFPSQNIVLREAIPVKDSEGKNPTQLLDALPKMNEAQTVTIPAKSSSLVWIELATKNLKSSLYQGSIRVIPLAEAATHTKNKYIGPIKDLPISLEVLPLKLPQSDNSWLCATSGTDSHFYYLRQLGASRIHITPFVFRFKFDHKGNIIDDNNSTSNAIKLITSNLNMYKKHNSSQVKTKFMFAYSVAKIFEEIVLPKSIKPMTVEWEVCWTNYLKEIRKIVHKCNLTMDDFVFELYDEPHGKMHDKLLRMTQLARQAIPDGKFSITWPPQKFQYTASQMAAYDDLLDEQMFHYLLHKDNSYTSQIRKIQKKPNVVTGLYQCSTNIRENLYSYYRLHPWIVFQGNYDIIGLYNFAAINWGQLGASDWKRVPYGAIVYRAGNNCIPSIRFMLLKKGIDDIRYLSMLKKYRHIKEVDKFLTQAPLKVVTSGHNPTLADKVRQETIKLLLKYHK